MEIIAQFQHFALLDGVALSVFLILWLAATLLIEHAPASRPSVSQAMDVYRRAWMDVVRKRPDRIVDASIVTNLRQGTAFFASTTLLTIGAGLTLIGNTEQLTGVATDLSVRSAPEFVWEVKLIVILLVVVNAFLKFVWSHRLFGYASVLIAAIPKDHDHPHSQARADAAGAIIVTASRNFNRGIRAIYFALASAAWFIGPLPLIAASLVSFAVLYRREFISASREVLLRELKEEALK